MKPHLFSVTVKHLFSVTVTVNLVEKQTSEAFSPWAHCEMHLYIGAKCRLSVCRVTSFCLKETVVIYMIVKLCPSISLNMAAFS